MMVVETARNKCHFLLGTFGETANQRVFLLLNIESFESFSYFHVKNVTRNLAELAHELQELGHRETRVNGRVLGEVAYNTCRVLGLIDNIVRGQSSGSPGRLGYSRNHRLL